MRSQDANCATNNTQQGVTHAAAMRAVAVIALATYSLNNLKFEVSSFSRFRDISGDVKF